MRREEEVRGGASGSTADPEGTRPRGRERPGIGGRRESTSRPAPGRRHAGGAEARDRYRAFVESDAYRRQRPEKARVIARICGDEIRRSERTADFGAGTGIVKKELEKITGTTIVGFELDRSFIEVGERMAVADVTELPVADGELDFAVLNHLYEHVDDQPGLFEELHRVLAASGAAYVSAGSRWAVMEPHYRLPFLSWLPRSLADAYLRLTGRGEAYRGIRFRGYRRLTGMMRDAGFRVEDRTAGAIDDLVGETWGQPWAAAWRMVRALPGRVVEHLLRALSPQWFFVLHKAPGGTGSRPSGDRPARTGGEERG